MTGLTPIQRRSIIKKRNTKRRKTVDERQSNSNDLDMEVANPDPEPEVDERKLIEEYTKRIQQEYKENVQRIKDDTSEEARFVKVAMIEAEEIWLNVQVLLKSKMYATMSEDQKVNLIQKDFAMFYKNFPIVARYMICHGQYNSNAFRKMLINCKNTKADGSTQPLSSNDKGKGRMEEPIKKDNELLWIERQADYVRFLWEEYQDNKFLQDNSDNIWKQAFDALSKEFKEFKELHEKMEKKVKEDAIKHKKELLFEMSSRIIDGAQSLDKKSAMDLKITLQNKVFKQRYDNLLKTLLKTHQPIEPVLSGVGLNEEHQKEYEAELQQSYYKKNYKKLDFNKLKI